MRWVCIVGRCCRTTLSRRSQSVIMAVSMRTQVSASSVAKASPRARTVVCKAQNETKAQLAAVAFAAAALISAAPAQAGVVLAQPELKKVFQSDESPAPVQERPFRVPGAPSAPAPAAEAVAAAPAPKKEKVEVESFGEGGLDPRAIALPGAIVAVAGLGLVASKVDGGFNEWLNESGALVRNSGAYAGFEEEIKGDNYFGGAYSNGTTSAKKGTTKVAAKGTTKVGTKRIFGRK